MIGALLTALALQVAPIAAPPPTPSPASTPAAATTQVVLTTEAGPITIAVNSSAPRSPRPIS
ncbi:hypothetical protein AB5I41_31860 [Sphingomonas sp. MMS24-JH45]